MTTAPLNPVRVPATVQLDGATWSVRRAWPNDGKGLPVELALLDDETPRVDDVSRRPGPPGGARVLRGARIIDGDLLALPVGVDKRLPALQALTEKGGVVVSHRPGKRAVVRTVDGTFVKVVRPGKAQAILDGIGRAQDFARTFRTPEVLASTDDTVTFTPLAGVELHEAERIGADRWTDAWRDVLEAWMGALHGAVRVPLGEVDAADAPVHDADAEIAVLTQWRERADSVDSGHDLQVRSVVIDRAIDAVRSAPRPTDLFPSHRDLHDKQVLWDPELGPGMLDVDTAAYADPALDLGNLRAHATWRDLQGLWTAEQAEEVRALIDQLVRRAMFSREAVEAYELATLARLTCVYAFRPQWNEAVGTLLQHLAPSSNRGAEESAGAAALV